MNVGRVVEELQIGGAKPYWDCTDGERATSRRKVYQLVNLGILGRKGREYNQSSVRALRARLDAGEYLTDIIEAAEKRQQEAE